MMHSRDLGRQFSMCVRYDDGPVDTEKQRRDMGGYRQERDMGEYRQDSGVRREIEKMRGFRRLQMIRMLVMFWRLLVLHARDQTEPQDVERVWLLVRVLW